MMPNRVCIRLEAAGELQNLISRGYCGQRGQCFLQRGAVSFAVMLNLRNRSAQQRLDLQPFGLVEHRDFALTTPTMMPLRHDRRLTCCSVI
jgi:hypothetical protein